MNQETLLQEINPKNLRLGLKPRLLRIAWPLQQALKTIASPKLICQLLEQPSTQLFMTLHITRGNKTVTEEDLGLGIPQLLPAMCLSQAINRFPLKLSYK